MIKSLFNEYVQSLETYIMFQIAQRVQELKPLLEKKGRAPISLSMGAPTEAPPQLVIDKLKEYIDNKTLHSYSTSKGEARFIDAISARMKKRFGVDVGRDEICSLIGSKEGIANFIRELINPCTEEKQKDIIMIPDPGYASYKEMVKVSGGLAYSIPLTVENNYMPDMAEVVKNLEKEGYDKNKIKAIVINYPNNPLGVNATDEYLKSVLNYCLENKILLISDAAYTDMYFGGEKAPVSILSFDRAKEIAVEFYSLSKPYAMTGWRLGWICGNKEAVSMFSKLKSTIDTGIFKPLQYAAADILNSEEGDLYIEESNKNYEKKQAILVEGFKKLGWKLDNIPKTTFYLWLPVPPRYKTSKEFTDEVLEKSGVVLVPGDAFGEQGKGFFRLSIVASDENLHKVIERLEIDGFTF